MYPSHTINENMPLRLLLYITKVYESLLGEKNIYRSRRLSLSLPEFIVLYNGKTPYPDETTMKLSDAFRNPGEIGLGVKRETPLELAVKVYNINPGHNEPIIRRCKTLAGYSAFVEKVRGYEGEGKSREEAIRGAIKECIRQNILKEFLERHTREVMNMLMTEWNWEDALAVQREEGREEAAVEYTEQIRQVQEQIRRLEEEIRRLRGV
jgi:hypothetical protein